MAAIAGERGSITPSAPCAEPSLPAEAHGEPARRRKSPGPTKSGSAVKFAGPHRAGSVPTSEWSSDKVEAESATTSRPFPQPIELWKSPLAPGLPGSLMNA